MDQQELAELKAYALRRRITVTALICEALAAAGAPVTARGPQPKA